jgi:alpha-1,3-rhamnosyltransferase
MNVNVPLVSVVVPSYNHVQYIEKCIDTIMTQDYPNIELIVIDDGSSDNSPQVLHDLQKKYGFYLECNQNQGISKTLNRGFRDLAKGKYLTFCASDDYWLPGKLWKQVNFLEENLDCGMVYGKAICIASNGTKNDIKTNELNKNLTGGFIFKDIIFNVFHPPVNYMLRGNVLKELGYYREHIWAEDFDMNLRISYKFPIGFINDFLSCYRITDSPNEKMLNFKTIFSHLDSINQFKNSPYYQQAIKKWYYRCFLWYSPYRKGKILALKGMIHNLDQFYKKEFLIFITVLIRHWK